MTEWNKNDGAEDLAILIGPKRAHKGRCALDSRHLAACVIVGASLDLCPTLHADPFCPVHKAESNPLLPAPHMRRDGMPAYTQCSADDPTTTIGTCENAMTFIRREIVCHPPGYRMALAVRLKLEKQLTADGHTVAVLRSKGAQ